MVRTSFPVFEVGIVLRDDTFAAGSQALRDVLLDIDRAGIDFVGVLDHLSFWDGAGFDGLINATAVLAAHPTLSVRTAVYLLPLRHPLAVARQLSSLGVIAPGRFTFGVGVGGEDRREVAAAGVCPSTRGRRMDASLAILRDFMTSGCSTHDSEFFALDGVRVWPRPDPTMPILIGGRSGAALDRTARFGDGWIGFAVSPRRYSRAVVSIEQRAAAFGRTAAWDHGLVVWCGLADDRAAARHSLATEMEALYKLPFEKFARYAAWGSPDDIAARLSEYVDAGCRSFTLIPVAAAGASPVDGVARVRQLLNGSRAPQLSYR